MIGLGPYLCVSVALLALGLCCVAARRSWLHAGLGLQLILIAASINFVAFARHREDPLDGRMCALFVIVLAAVELAVALAIFVQLARKDRA